MNDLQHAAAFAYIPYQWNHGFLGEQGFHLQRTPRDPSPFVCGPHHSHAAPKMAGFDTLSTAHTRVSGLVPLALLPPLLIR